MTLSKRSRLQILKSVKICLTAHNAISPMVFIIGTVIAYGVQVTIGYLETYDPGVKGRGHIYLKPVYGS